MFEQRSVGVAPIIAVLFGICTAPTARAEVIVVPNALATIDGNSFDQTPSGSAGALRLLYVFDASQFAALSGPAFLTGYTFRHDIAPGPSGPRMIGARIFASTTSRPVTGLSNTFADNIGADNTLVFDGTLTWLTSNLPGPGNTQQFDIVNELTTPFLYNPQAGNLALDLQYFSTGGSAIRFDADTSPTVNRLISLGSATATTGSVLGSGLVTQFTFQPIPEPTSLLLVVSAVTTCGLRRRTVRQRPECSFNSKQSG